MKTLKHYFIHHPGMVYASDTYGYDKRDALARYRTLHQISRMPKGFAIWEA